MTFLKKPVAVILSMLSIMPVLISSDSKIPVGIYAQGHGVEGIKAFLQKDKSYDISIFSDLNPETIKNYKVIIFSNSTKVKSEPPSNITEILMNYVYNGGGILFTHNAASFCGDFSVNPFPWIGFGINRVDDKITKGPDSEVAAAAQETHPITRGWLKDFEHMFSDHIALEPGIKGKILLQDRFNTPTALAGEPFENGGGRIVMMGLLPGYNAFGAEAEPAGMEGKLLTETLQWLSAGTPCIAPSDTALKKYAQERERILKEYEQNHGKLLKPENLKKTRFNWKGIFYPNKSAAALNENGVNTLLNDMKRLGLNAVLFPGIFMGDAFYPDSKIYPTYPLLKATGTDTLKMLSEKAQNNNIKVYALVSPFMEGMVVPTAYLKNNPDLLQISEQEYEKGITDPASVAVPWTCPDNPVVRKRVIKAVCEMMNQYPALSGISLDFIRYKDGRACFCKYSIAQRDQYIKKHSEFSASEARSKYSEESIVSFVKELRTALNSIRPDIEIHAYTHPSWANKFPLDIHSKRASGATLKDSNFTKIEQCYNAALNLNRNVKRFYEKTKAAPMVDLASGKSPERLCQEIRAMGAAGADSICVWSYDAFTGECFSIPNIDAMKMLSCELDGEWTPRPAIKAEMMFPSIPSRKNLISNGSFEKLQDSELKLTKVAFASPGKIGEKCAVLNSESKIETPLYEAIPGNDYTVSAYVKLPQTDNNKNILVKLNFYDEERKQIYSRICTCLPETEWQRISITREAPTTFTSISGKKTAYVNAEIFARSPDIKVDGFKLEEGTLPSVF